MTTIQFLILIVVGRSKNVPYLYHYQIFTCNIMPLLYLVREAWENQIPAIVGSFCNPYIKPYKKKTNIFRYISEL